MKIDEPSAYAKANALQMLAEADNLDFNFTNLETPILVEPRLKVHIANQVFCLSGRRVPRTLIWSGTPHVVHNFHRKPKLRALVARQFEEALRR